MVPVKRGSLVPAGGEVAGCRARGLSLRREESPARGYALWPRRRTGT